MLRRLGRFFVRVFAFLRKEIVNVMRQPKLILTLVLGPFLILFFFGIGFDEAAPTMRTLFLANADNALRPYIEEYATTISPQLFYAGVTQDWGLALRSLQDQSVDTVVVVPRDALATIQDGDQATFDIYHDEIMPTEAGYVSFAMNTYMGEVNRRVVAAMIENEQEDLLAMREDLTTAQETLNDAQSALASDDADRVSEDLVKLEETIQSITSTMETDTITEEQELRAGLWTSGTLGMLENVQRDIDHLQAMGLDDPDNQATSLRRIEGDLRQINAMLDVLEEVESYVASSPFKANTTNIAPVEIEMMDYYTPGVVALLLQHLSVTFAALSIVQEERIGAIELFQIAPISALEMLLGKYLSYLLFNGLIATVLILLSVYGLNVPLQGAWWHVALVIAGMTFASLSLGFLISLISRTTSQAVQASMILLLSSVFFTGFLQTLESLKPWVRVISWSLPATYGIRMLQNVMLRGWTPRALLLVVLVVAGGAVLMVNLRLLYTHMRKDA